MKNIPSTRADHLKKGLLICLVLFVFYLGVGFLGIPAIGKWYVNKKLPEKVGRSVSVEKIALNPLVFSIRVTNLAVDDDLQDELLRIGNCYANLQVFPTLFGKVTLKSFELTESSFRAVMNEEGIFNFDQLTKVEPITQEIEVAEDTVDIEQGEDVFELPMVRIQTIFLSHLIVHFEDKSIQNPFEKDFHLDELSILELNTYPEQEMPLSLNANIANSSRLGLTADIISLYPLDLNVDFNLSHFDLSSIQPYLSEYAEVEINGSLDVSFQSSLKYLDGVFNCALESDSLLNVHELHVRDISNDADMLNVEHVEIQNVGLDTSAGTINYTIEIVEPRIELTRLSDGSIQLPTYFLTAESEPLETRYTGEEGSEPFAIVAALDSLRVSGGTVIVDDEALKTPSSLAVQNLDVVVQNVLYAVGINEISGDLAATTSFELQNGGSFGMKAGGDLAENVYRVDLDIAEIDLSQFQPYVEEYIRGRVKSGLFGSSLRIDYQLEDNRYELDGTVQLNDFQLLDAETETLVAGVEEVKLNDLKVDNESAVLASVEISSPEGRFFIAEDSSHTISRMIIADESLADDNMIGDDESVSTEESSFSAAMDVSIKEIHVTNGSFEFVDNSLLPAFKTQMSKLNFELNDFSTVADNVSEFELSARINDAAELRGVGELDLLAPAEHTIFEMNVSAFDVSSASTYGQKFVGRKIDQGHFFLDSKIVVNEQELKGENLITLKSFTLGDSVDSPDALGLPVGLAVAVLQDSNGVIKQSIPVHGDLSEPGVPVGRIALNAAMTALRNVVIKAATSPFKLLAGMVGGDEDMDVLDFSSGQSKLLPGNSSKLDSFVKILEDRPGLKVEIETHFDPLLEREFFREQLLLMSLENYTEGELSIPEVIHPLEQLCNQTPDHALLLDRLGIAMTNGLLQESIGAEVEMNTADVEKNPAEVQQANENSVEDNERKSANFFSRTLSRVTGIFSSEDDSGIEEGGDVETADDNEVIADAVLGETATPKIVATKEDLARALQMIPDDVVKDIWIQELAIARMNTVSTLLLDQKGIAPERLFFNQNSIPSDSSYIQFKLTD